MSIKMFQWGTFWRAEAALWLSPGPTYRVRPRFFPVFKGACLINLSSLDKPSVRTKRCHPPPPSGPFLPIPYSHGPAINSIDAFPTTELGHSLLRPGWQAPWCPASPHITSIKSTFQGLTLEVSSSSSKCRLRHKRGRLMELKHPRVSDMA